MTIQLRKGARINLSKSAPSLKIVRVGLGWDANHHQGSAYDLDASVFICRHNAKGEPKLLSEEHFVFYNNRSSPNAAVVHSGDNQTGDGDGDDEVITLDLRKIDREAVELSFIVTIHEARERQQSFGEIHNAYIRLYDDISDQIVAEYRLDQMFAQETAVQFGSLLREDGQWTFKAVGAGYQLTLGDFVDAYL